MNDILTQLRPQEALRHDEEEFGGKDVAGWGSHAGHGNLSRSGGIESMTVPRVPDVSGLAVHDSSSGPEADTSSPQHSSAPTPTRCRPIRRPRSSWRTVRQRWPLGSREVSLLPSTRERPPVHMSVCPILILLKRRGTDAAASGTVKKVIEINPYLLGTMAGGAADCQYWCVTSLRLVLAWEADHRLGRRIWVCSVDWTSCETSSVSVWPLRPRFSPTSCISTRGWA